MSMAIGYDPLGHLQTLGVVVNDVALPPIVVCALVGKDLKLVQSVGVGDLGG
jgi:hypothetical protein